MKNTTYCGFFVNLAQTYNFQKKPFDNYTFITFVLNTNDLYNIFYFITMLKFNK